jgi:hypothetical protein
MPRKGSRKLAPKNENMPEMRSFYRVHETRMNQSPLKLIREGSGKNRVKAVFFGGEYRILGFGFWESKASQSSGRFQTTPKRAIF